MTALPSQAAFVWSKLASAKWEDAWVERLQFLGPSRLAIFALPGSRRIRIEAYGLNKRDGGRLLAAFGGGLRSMKGNATQGAGNESAAPLLIRNRLTVVRSPKSALEAERARPGRLVLVVPAAMAFGTGDHATTATCLRMICDIAAAQTEKRWEALDLGTGTGILALAARLLGASRCDGWDFDPACIRAARENARLNRLKGVAIKRIDVTEWTPRRQWDLVTANLYSEVLISVSSKIAAAVKPKGRLILSGMLASQAEETIEVFKRADVVFDRIVKRGKWVTALGAVEN